MKKPNLQDLIEDQEMPVVMEEKPKTAPKSFRKTYAFEAEDIEYINSIVVELTNLQGKGVSASEALRTIIRQHKAAKS